MDKKSFVSYQDMNAYLKEHPDHKTGNVFSDAAIYFEKEGLLQEYAEPFSLDQDIILMPDEEFLSICDHLPIYLNRQDAEFLLSYSLFPPNYDCYVVRHLNALHVGWHSHDFFEICYVWKGSCKQKSKDMSYQLEEGDFLIIPPDVRHRVESVSSDSLILNIMVRTKTFHTTSVYFMTQSNAIASFFRHSLMQEHPVSCLSLHTGNDLFLKRIIKHFCQECYLLPSVFCDFATSIFQQLLCYLMLHSEVNTEPLHLPDRFFIISILHDIQEHFDEVTLKTLAQKYFFSEEHLSRYITFECFDEDQILEGTIDDGIVKVDYDLTGFVAGDAQLIWDDAVASEEIWAAR